MLAVVIEAQSSLVFLRDLLMVSFVYQFIEDKMVIPWRIGGGGRGVKYMRYDCSVPFILCS